MFGPVVERKGGIPYARSAVNKYLGELGCMSMEIQGDGESALQALLRVRCQTGFVPAGRSRRSCRCEFGAPYKKAMRVKEMQKLQSNCDRFG